MNKLLFLITAIVMSLFVVVCAAFAFAPEPHVHEYASETTEATCTVDGATVYTCECGDSYTEKIPALGHTEETVEGKNATCLEAGITDGKKCTVCGETLVAQETIAALGHKMVTDEAVAPTCTDTGLAEGSHCSRCDYKVAQEVVPALGHDMVVDEAVPATCNDTGLTEGSHCSRCDHKVEQEVVPALGHDVKILAAVKPTCTETGLRQGYYCARCDGYNIKQDVVPALGHAYDDIYDETCNTCGHVRDAACHHTNKVAVGEAKEPTCTEAGITEGVKCSECDEILEPQEIKEKLGHDPVNHEAKAPTCTEIGWDAYETCSRCDYTTYAEKSALDHDRISHEAKAPTCTEIGWDAYETCLRCDYTTYVEIAALGHNHQPAVTEPTCTEIGYTTYTCSACGDNYRADEVAALGHSYGAWSLATEPTYATAGALSKTCGTCSHVDTKNIGVVSADNGYTLVITGVLSRWQYALDGQTFTFDITETVDTTDGKNTYSDDATAWYCGFDASGAMVKLDGYKTTNAAWDGTNRSFGGRNMTYITTIVAPEDTTVTLVLNCARNKAKPFFNDGVEWVLNWIKVNGSEDGVIYDTTSTLNKTGWHNYNDYAIATLFLKEGENVISLQSSTTVNIKGIGFISSETIHIHTDVIDKAVDAICTETGLTQGVHCSECNEVILAQEIIPVTGAHIWGDEYIVDTAPDYNTEGKILNKCTVCGVNNEEDPITIPAISEANGYTKVFGGVISRWTFAYNNQIFTFDIVENAETTDYLYGLESFYVGTNDSGSMVFKSGYKHTDATQPKYGCCFMDGSGKTFTTTVVVSETTSVTLLIKASKNSASTYDATFSSVTVNGDAAAVINTTTEALNFGGWHVHEYFEIATIVLEKGTNVIEFKSKANTNFAGIGFKSVEEIHMHTDVIDLGVAPTCLEEGKTDGIHCSTCDAVIVAQETISATGHIGAWTHTMTTKPTYTTEGLIESVETCTVCNVVNTTESFIVPVVDKDTEGFELLVTGVASRWQYTYHGTEFIIELMESGVTTETYSFGIEAWYVDRNGTGTPIGSSGYKHTTATWNGTNLCYGKANKTYTTTIVVDKPTAVTLLITAARNKAKPFYSTTGAEHVLDWIKVNGSEDGVIYDMNSKLNSKAWYGWQTTAIATLFLEAGTNVITFDTSTNTNFNGIGFQSTEEIRLAGEKIDLNLMSFNIRQDTDSGVKAWSNRKDALIQLIIDANPSVICFQEVKKGQYNDLAAGLSDYTVVYYGRGGSTSEGLAIAYKNADWEEISRQRFWLSETPDVESKGWGASYLRIAVNVLLKHKTTGQYLNVFTVHLDFSTTPKVNGIKLIMERAAEMSEAAGIDYPTYIAGDFNDQLGAEAYMEASKQYRDPRYYAPVTDFYTTGSKWGAASDTSTETIIDHIFVSKKHFTSNVFEVIRTRDETGFYPSDHFAVMAKVSLLVPNAET